MTTNVTQAQNATASVTGQVHAANGLALVRLTIGAMFVWVFFENLGKGTYTPAGYRGNHVLSQDEPLTSRMEVGYGIDGKPCGDGSSDASSGGDLARNPAGHRSVHASSGLRRIPAPRQPLDLGVGHVMDLETT